MDQSKRSKQSQPRRQSFPQAKVTGGLQVVLAGPYSHWLTVQGALHCPDLCFSNAQVEFGGVVAAGAEYKPLLSTWLCGMFASVQVVVSLVFRWFCGQVEAYFAVRGVDFAVAVPDKCQPFGLEKGGLGNAVA